MLCTPLYPMVLLIIIPFLNGYFIGKIPNIFRQTHMKTAFRKSVQKKKCMRLRDHLSISQLQCELSIPFDVCIIRLSKKFAAKTFPASEALQNLAVQNAVSPWDESNVCRSQLLSQDVRSLDPGLGHNLTLWLRSGYGLRWQSPPPIRRCCSSASPGQPCGLPWTSAPAPGKKVSTSSWGEDSAEGLEKIKVNIHYNIWIYIYTYIYIYYIHGMSEKKHQDC